MAKLQIGIGLGHGGKQPGASAVMNHEGKNKIFLEKDLVRKMAPFLLDFLNNSGKFEAKTLNELCGKLNDATWQPVQQHKDVEAMLKSHDLAAIFVFHFDSAVPTACGWSFCYNSGREGDMAFAQKYYEGARFQGSALSVKIDVEGNRTEHIKPRTDLAMLKIDDLVQNLEKAGLAPKAAQNVALSMKQAIDEHLRTAPARPLADTVRATLGKHRLSGYIGAALPLADKIERSMLLTVGKQKPQMNLLLVECGFLSNIGDLKAAVDRPSDIALVNYTAINNCFQ